MISQANAYATVEDLEERYRFLSDEEKAKAEILLEDAAVKIRLEFKNAGVRIDETEDMRNALKIVSCAMVKRVLSSPQFEDALGSDVKEFRTEVGVLSETYGFANPDGSMYLKNEEKKLLGIVNIGKVDTIPFPCLRRHHA